MSIEVIGAGMGRTGTLSLKHALEELGYNKTHHMFELMQNPPQLPHWMELHETRKTDFDKLFKGYTAAVDFPAALYYKELMEKYPNAKVVLTARDPEKWYKSAYDTIFQAPPGGLKGILIRIISLFKPDLRHIINVISYAKKSIWEKGGLFKDSFADKKKALEIYNSWNDEVKRYVPKDKLLVFEVSEGWEPLCKFLGKPIPSKPFPRVNDTAEFNERKKKLTRDGKADH